MTGPVGCAGSSKAEDALLAGRLQIGGLEPRLFALLAAIETTGSISRAARVAGLSYKGAWLLLERATNLAQEPLLATSTGGSRGGGATVTAAGEELLHLWRQLAARRRQFLPEQEARLQSQPLLGAFLRRRRMNSTAPNRFAGTVTAVQAGPVGAEATLRLKGGQEIVATMTAAAAGT